MFLKESSMNRWKGLDVLGGRFDEKMERLGVLEERFNERWEGWDVL